MPRYAMINTFTGYLVGVETAPNPIAACRQLNDVLCARSFTYELHKGSVRPERDVGLWNYEVHETPIDYECTTHGDRAQIALVQAMPFKGIVIALSPDDEDDRPSGD